MKDKTTFHNIIFYVLLVFALSGLLVLLQSAFSAFGDYWLVFPQFAPVLTVIALFVVRGKKKAAINIKQTFSVNKKVLAFCLCSAAFVFIVLGGFGFILSNYGKPFSQWAIPRLQWETPSLAIGLACILMGCIGEEIGWRGFLLPACNRSFSLILSSLISGIIWGAWHLDFGDGAAGFFVTVLFMTALSILMSWVQRKSGGSIIPAIVFHFFINFFARSTLFNMSLFAHFALALLLAALSIVLFIADRKAFASKESIA